MTTPNLAEFQVVLGLNKSVIVNGQEIAGSVRQLQINQAPDKPHTLLLELNGEGTIEGEGIVYVQTSRMNALDFLMGVDPGELEKAALEAQQWTEEPIVKTVIRLLVEAASDIESGADQDVRGEPVGGHDPDPEGH